VLLCVNVIVSLQIIKKKIFFLFFGVGVKLGLSYSGRGHRLKVLENGTLRKIFGTGWEEVTGGWRKLPKGSFMTLHLGPRLTWKTFKRILKEQNGTA